LKVKHGGGIPRGNVVVEGFLRKNGSKEGEREFRKREAWHEEEEKEGKKGGKGDGIAL
jgi:hypothetical protein